MDQLLERFHMLSAELVLPEEHKIDPAHETVAGTLCRF